VRPSLLNHPARCDLGQKITAPSRKLTSRSKLSSVASKNIGTHGRRDAGVVDEQIEPGEGMFSEVHEAKAVGGSGDVRWQISARFCAGLLGLGHTVSPPLRRAAAASPAKLIDQSHNEPANSQGNATTDAREAPLMRRPGSWPELGPPCGAERNFFPEVGSRWVTRLELQLTCC